MTQQPVLHKALPPRLAVVTLAHRARNTSRFLTGTQIDHDIDALPCAVIVQALALREIGGFGPSVDIVLLQSQLLPEQLKMIKAHDIKVHTTDDIPDADLYGSEFEAATMLKVDAV